MIFFVVNFQETFVFHFFFIITAVIRPEIWGCHGDRLQRCDVMEFAKYVGLQTCQKNIQLPVALKTDAVDLFETALRMNKTISTFCVSETNIKQTVFPILTVFPEQPIWYLSVYNVKLFKEVFHIYVFIQTRIVFIYLNKLGVGINTFFQCSWSDLQSL